MITAELTTTFGYIEQRQYVVDLSAPYSVKCDQKALITAKVTKVKNGAPVANQAVGWSFVAKQSSRDRLSRDMSVTNRQGIASVKVSFGPKAGKRIVKATVPGVKMPITVRCKGGLG